jgi:predicted ATPase
VTVKHLHIENFKCFEKLDIDLSSLVLLIGPNASGKSNFVQIFQFLSDIRNSGLEDAIALQGGTEYLRNLQVGAEKNIKIEVEVRDPYIVWRKIGSSMIGLKGDRTFYYLEIETNKTNSNFKIVREELKTKFDCVSIEEKDNEPKKIREITGKSDIKITKRLSKVSTSASLTDYLDIQFDDLVPSIFKYTETSNKDSLLNSIYMMLEMFENIFDNFGIYDFDPKLSKQAIPMMGKTELEPDGKNIAIVLKHLLNNKSIKKRFIQYINSLLPFIEEPYAEKVADKSILMKIQETYYGKNNAIPASLISDGTINITSIIIALFFSKNSLIIFEEPERNIHPNLISKLMNYMEEASKEAQIFLTTHNPEVIKQTELDSLYFITRDEKGMSNIFRPHTSKEIQTFLENKIGIDELFIQNLIPV